MPPALQVLTPVPPGETKRWTWNQTDQAGSPVPLGTYIIELRTDAGTYTTTFQIVAPSFADVPPTYWAFQQIEALYRSGITTGCVPSSDPATRAYCPEAAVTRAQMAVFLVRAKHGSAFTPPPAMGLFADVPTNYWAAAWIEQLYRDGITTGCVPSTDPASRYYCPEAAVTRAQMAVFLERYRDG